MTDNPNRVKALSVLLALPLPVFFYMMGLPLVWVGFAVGLIVGLTLVALMNEDRSLGSYLAVLMGSVAVGTAGGAWMGGL
ncbi:hypothetical protein HKCCE3408_04310 [Rhodobacterales bacterium HKCCE3408]|nr:hypothetical protein [Rhodobacterales bacterium HKCCE3408]